MDSPFADLQPTVSIDEYVFCTLPPGPLPPNGAEPIALVRESEGLTLVLERQSARRLGLPEAFVCRQITLAAPTDLNSVGILARVTAALAEAGIPVNPVAGYYHDHLFVPVDRADEAMRVLGGS